MEAFLKVRGYTIPKLTDQKKHAFIREQFQLEQTHSERYSWRLFADIEPVYVDNRMAVDLICHGEEDIIIVSMDYKSQQKIGKAEISNLMTRAAVTAHTILILNSLSAQAKALTDFMKVKKGQFVGEILHWHEILIPKLLSRKVPRYQVLTEAEIVEVEKKTQTSRVKFTPFFPSDKIVRYIGFRLGQVVYSMDTKLYRYVG